MGNDVGIVRDFIITRGPQLAADLIDT